MKKGFSLFELIIAISIASIVTFSLYAIQKDVITFNRFVSGGLSREGEIRKFLKNFSTQVRVASPSSTGGYLVEEASSTSFTFYTDADNNGIKERVRYFLSGGVLRRGVTVPTGAPLSYNLGSEQVALVVTDIISTSTIFFYYDNSSGGASVPLATPVPVSSVRLVKITFLVDPNSGKSPVPSTFTSQATIRNLRNQ